jgi:beta-xylosidase
VKRVLGEAGWDDPCPFWDDDGRAYLVTTHFKTEVSNGKSYNIHLFRMTADGEHLTAGSDRIIHQSKGSEANKLYKIDGVYYHYYSEIKAEGRVPIMERARSLSGPWEQRQLMHVQPTVDKEPNPFGADDNATRAIDLRINTPDFRWVTLTEQKWVTSRERRGSRSARCERQRTKSRSSSTWPG